MGIKVPKIKLIQLEEEVNAERGYSSNYQNSGDRIRNVLVDEYDVNGVIDSNSDYSSYLNSNSNSINYDEQLRNLKEYQMNQNSTIKIIDTMENSIKSDIIDVFDEDFDSVYARYNEKMKSLGEEENRIVVECINMLNRGPLNEEESKLYEALGGEKALSMEYSELLNAILQNSEEARGSLEDKRNAIDGQFALLLDQLNKDPETGEMRYSFGSIQDIYDKLIQLESERKTALMNVVNIDRMLKLLPYQSMMNTDEYRNWENNSTSLKQEIFDECFAGFNNETFQSFYSWSKYSQSENISPAQFLLNISFMENSRHLSFLYSGSSINVQDEDGFSVNALNKLISASRTNPDLLKGYNYLYYTKGLDKANEYLEGIEEEINKNIALQSVVNWQKSLPEGTNIQDAIERGGLVTLKGLEDGVGQFGRGLGAWFDSSINRTVADFEVMYITMLLQTGDVKRQSGLIDENGNSTSLIDFSRDYSGKLDISDNIYEISTSIGNMLPSMALSAINPVLGTTAMGISAGGNSYHQRIIEGSDKGTAVLYGVLSGASEALLEKALGTIPFIGNKDNAVKTLKQLLLAMPKEGIEEGAQEVFDIALSHALYGESITFDEAMARVGKSALYGAITSGIMNATGATVTKTGEIVFKNRDTNVRNLIKGVADAIGVEVTERDVDTFINENVILNSSTQVDSKIGLLLDYVQNIGVDVKSVDGFNAEINKIHNMTNDMLPQGFSSVDEYKKVFVQALVESGKLNEMDSRLLVYIAADTTIFSEVINTEIGREKLDSLFENNLSRIGAHTTIIPLLKNFDTKTFNSFFEDSAVQNTINSLDGETFASMVKQINTTFKTNWVESPVLVDKVCNMSVEEFYHFLNSNGFSSLNVNKLKNKADLDVTSLNKLFQTIDEKFCTFENFTQNYEYLDSMVSKLPIDSFQNKFGELSKNIDHIKEKELGYKELIFEKLKSNSLVSLNILESSSFPTILVNTNDIYYNMVVEIDGKEESLKVINDGGRLSLKKAFTSDYIKALTENRLLIKGIEVNSKASALFLKNLGHGLNEVTFEVDGKQTKLIVDGKTRNFRDLSDNFEDAKTVKLLSIKSFDSCNVNVDKAGDIYSIKYNLNGKEYESFILSEKGDFRSSQNIVDVDAFIIRNNLTGIDNVRVEKIKDEDVGVELSSIFSPITSANGIFKTDSYGGNQSDVKSFLSSSNIGNIQKINSQLQEQLISYDDVKKMPIDMQKGLLLSSMIDEYYPNATDEQKSDLAEHYANGGCEYMAFSNAFSTYMSSLENGAEVFKNRFGFDLYITDADGNQSYNLEALAFDMYLKYFSSKYDGDISATLKDTDVGIGDLNIQSKIDEYFTNHGIDVNSTAISKDFDNLENVLLVGALNQENSFAIVESNKFKLESLMDYDKGDTCYSLSPHAMLVTDFDEQGNLVVSSWKRKYKFLADSVNKNDPNSYARVRTISFAIQDDYKG